MSEQDTGPERNLGRMELKPASLSAPEPVLDHLEELAERAHAANASKREVIAALIASCDLEEDELIALVMTYRKAHAVDLPISPPQSTEA